MATSTPFAEKNDDFSRGERGFQNEPSMGEKLQIEVNNIHFGTYLG